MQFRLFCFLFSVGFLPLVGSLQLPKLAVPKSSAIKSNRRSFLRTSLLLPFLPQAANAASTSSTITPAPPPPILCNPSLSTLKKNGRTVTILGTAHVSDSSAELSRDLVRALKPDTVFVELDAKRVKGGRFGEAGDNSAKAAPTPQKPSFMSAVKSKILGKVRNSFTQPHPPFP